MRVTLAQMEAFYWTVHLGSAQRAASHLNLAQPTLSLRLRDLQAALGVEVLERSGRGLRPTPEGRALLARVEIIMAEMRAIGARDPAREIAGPIRIGLAEGFAVTCLPPLLAALQEAHPALLPDWTVTTSTALEISLLRDGLDLAVLLNPLGDERLRMIPLGAQPTSWVVPAAWNLTGPVTPRDLWNLPVLSNPPPSAMHRQVSGWFATAGIAPTRLITCNSVAIIAELVAAGMGAGLLPVRMADRFLGGGMALLPTMPEVENGRLYAAHHMGADDAKVTAVIRTTERVLQSIGYHRA